LERHGPYLAEPCPVAHPGDTRSRGS
jgi:hypothetical protein